MASGVKFRSVDATAMRYAHGHRDREAATSPGAESSRVRAKLVVGRAHESLELKFGNGTHAVHRQSNRTADDARFSQRGIHHPVRPKFSLQSFGRAEHTSVESHIFTQDDDPIVQPHFAGQSIGDGLDKRHFGFVGSGGHARSSGNCPRLVVRLLSRWRLRDAGKSAYM